MKLPHLILSAAVFTFAACDGEKVQEAKKESTEAAKSIGEAVKEVGGKAVEKSKELGKTAVEKGKEIKEAAKTLIGEKGGPAMEAFKAKMGGLSEWFKKSNGQAGQDPGKAHQMMGELMARMKSISTEGLPEDLKGAFQGMQASMGRIQEMSRSLPTDEAGAEAWYKDNADKLRTLEKEFLNAGKKLKETAAKHGITGLNLGTE